MRKEIKTNQEITEDSNEILVKETVEDNVKFKTKA